MTVLMLDLDGVLNPDKMRNPHKTKLDGYHKINVNVKQEDDNFYDTIRTVRIWVTEDHGKYLNDLDLDIVWATSWVAYSDALDFVTPHYGLPLGLPMIDYDSERDEDLGNSGKLDGVRSWLKDNNRENEKLVWVDDDLGDKDFGWAEDRSADSLLLKTIPQKGLTLEMYKKIEDFIK